MCSAPAPSGKTEMTRICAPSPASRSHGRAQIELGERAEAPARERHGGEAEQEEHADQHLLRSSAGSGTPLNPAGFKFIGHPSR